MAEIDLKSAVLDRQRIKEDMNKLRMRQQEIEEGVMEVLIRNKDYSMFSVNWARLTRMVLSH